MQLFIDTADLGLITKAYDYFPLDGVTTNPTILSSTKRPPFEVLHELKEFLEPQGSILHCQVVSETAEGMLEEAKHIHDELGGMAYVKVPVTREGLRAIRMITENGINVTATTILTLQQAFLAAKAGASYAAPYLNRITNLGADGIDLCLRMDDMFACNNFDCKLLAASFVNLEQVTALMERGVGSATLPPEIFDMLLDNPVVDAAVCRFNTNFHNTYGADITMKD